MKAHLEILSLFAVFSGVLIESGGAYEGTVGGQVEIRCSYPDEYKYTPKYFCRHPCSSSDHVLIKSEKGDQYISNGRYSAIDTVSAKSFSVIIRSLRLSDSGVYYCGVDKWFKDKLIKVHLTVKPVAPVNKTSHTTENTRITSIWTTHTSAVTNSSSQQNNSSSDEQVSSTGHSQKLETPVESSVIVAAVCASVLVLLLFAVLVALVTLCKKRSDLKSRLLNSPAPENPVPHSPVRNQTADIYHIYDEMVIGDSSTIYSTVNLGGSAAQDDFNAPYSLIKPH